VLLKLGGSRGKRNEICLGTKKGGEEKTFKGRGKPRGGGRFFGGGGKEKWGRRGYVCNKKKQITGGPWGLGDEWVSSYGGGGKVR